jgi:hypothetical protein
MVAGSRLRSGGADALIISQRGRSRRALCEVTRDARTGSQATTQRCGMWTIFSAAP